MIKTYFFKTIMGLLCMLSSIALFSNNDFVIRDGFIKMDSIDIINTIKLDLSGRNLSQLPENLSQFTNLKSINLRGNKLKDIDGINENKLLEEIDLSNNKFLNLDKSVKELKLLFYLKRLKLNNNELSYLPLHLFKLKGLEMLEITGNNINVLPHEIKGLAKLKYLDVSNNNIRSVKPGLKNLKYLNYLDVSNNNIINEKSLLLQLSVLNKLDELKMDFNFKIKDIQEPIKAVSKLTLTNVNFDNNEYLLSSFKGLKSLSIKTKEVLDYRKIITAVNEHNKLKKLFVDDDQLIKLPFNINQFKSLEEINITGYLYEELPASMDKMESLHKISINNTANLNTVSLFLRLQRIGNLEELELKKCNLNSIDKKIERLKSLKKLNLEGNNLTVLPIEIANMKKLEQCNLTNNSILIEDIEAIIQKNNTCEFIYSNTQRKIDLVVKPPIETADIVYEKFNVDASESNIIYSSTGSNVIIPENAFRDKNGNIVQGNVQIEYREFNDPVDMVFSGIPMSFNKNGETFNFSSAGMMEFNAYQNNELLEPNLDNKITVNLKSESASKDYDLFYLDAEEKGWVNIGKDSISNEPVTVDEPRVELISKPKNFDLTEPEYPRFPFRKEYINFEIKRSLDKKSYQLNVIFKYSKYSNSNKVDKKFSELKVLSKNKWKIDIDRKKIKSLKEELDSMSQFISSYNNKVNRSDSRTKDGINNAYEIGLGMNLVEDCWLIPNLLKDNFDMCFLIGGDTLKIPVLPKRMPNKPEVLQKQFKRMYGKYKIALNQRREDWKYIDDKHDDYLNNYEAVMLNYQNEKRIYREKQANFYKKEMSEIGTYAANEQNIFRSFELTNFGFFNCDIINRMEKPENLLAEFVDIDFAEQSIKKIYILDKDNNGVTTYSGGEKKAFDAAHENSLIAILPNDKIGVISAKNFNKVLMKDRSAKVVLTIFDMKTTSVMDLRLKADFF